MKLLSFASAFTLAVTATTASAETCVLTDLATSLTSVIAPATACQTATGYSILPPTALPTTAQIAAICSQCQTLLTAARAVTFPSCTLSIGNTDVAISTLFNSIVNQCGSNTSSTDSSSSGSSAMAVTEPSAGDSLVTETPTKNSSSSSSGSGSIETPTLDGSSSTPTPTTTTTPSAQPSTTTAPPSTSTTSSAGATTIASVVVVAVSVVTLLL